MKRLSKLLLSATLLSGVVAIANDALTMDYTKDTRGLVRKMAVYKGPSWVGKVVTEENKVFYFSSPKSLLEYYYNPEKWPKANTPTQADIKDLIITDYSTLKPINAKEAFYVYGSSKISPAGDDLPAFKNYNQAKDFSDKYNGKRIMPFRELSNGLVKLLNGDI